MKHDDASCPDDHADGRRTCGTDEAGPVRARQRHMAPPEHALVFCCDEKSQVQALERTQPGLPLKKGRAETMTRNYKRNGTTTLFAAMNTLDGRIIRVERPQTAGRWRADQRAASLRPAWPAPARPAGCTSADPCG